MLARERPDDGFLGEEGGQFGDPATRSDRRSHRWHQGVHLGWTGMGDPDSAAGRRQPRTRCDKCPGLGSSLVGGDRTRSMDEPCQRRWGADASPGFRPWCQGARQMELSPRPRDHPTGMARDGRIPRCDRRVRIPTPTRRPHGDGGNGRRIPSVRRRSLGLCRFCRNRRECGRPVQLHRYFENPRRCPAGPLHQRHRPRAGHWLYRPTPPGARTSLTTMEWSIANDPASSCEQGGAGAAYRTPSA